MPYCRSLGKRMKRCPEMTPKNGKVSFSFDSFLADRIEAAMEKDRLAKAAMTIRMRTSRRARDRLLHPASTSVTLHTLQRAAVAAGRQLRLELI